MNYSEQMFKRVYPLCGADLGYSLANFAIKNILKNTCNDNKNDIFHSKILLISMGVIAGGALGYSLGTSLYPKIVNSMDSFKVGGSIIGGFIGASAAFAGAIISWDHELLDNIFWRCYPSNLILGIGIGAKVGYHFSTLIKKIHDKCSATNIALINNETNNHTRQSIQNFESTPLLPNDISNINAINNTHPNQNIYNTVVITPLLPK